DLEPLRPREVERAAHQNRSDAAAAQRGWHFRVGYGDAAGGGAVVSDRRPALGVEFEPVERRVVAHFRRHGYLAQTAVTAGVSTKHRARRTRRRCPFGMARRLWRP